MPPSPNSIPMNEWRGSPIADPSTPGLVTFHRIDDNTKRVTAQIDVDPDGFVENVADRMGILKTRVNGDLERFKKSIENTPTETGAGRGDVARPDA